MPKTKRGPKGVVTFPSNLANMVIKTDTLKYSKRLPDVAYNFAT